MRKAALLAAVAGLLAGCAEAPPAVPVATAVTAVGSDTLVILASDSYFGPSTADTAVAARYYCSTRGKLSQLLSRERPHEMQDDTLPEYAVLTYQCYVPLTAAR